MSCLQKNMTSEFSESNEIFSTLLSIIQQNRTNNLRTLQSDPFLYRSTGGTGTIEYDNTLLNSRPSQMSTGPSNSNRNRDRCYCTNENNIKQDLSQIKKHLMKIAKEKSEQCELEVKLKNIIATSQIQTEEIKSLQATNRCLLDIISSSSPQSPSPSPPNQRNRCINPDLIEPMPRLPDRNLMQQRLDNDVQLSEIQVLIEQNRQLNEIVKRTNRDYDELKNTYETIRASNNQLFREKEELKNRLDTANKSMEELFNFSKQQAIQIREQTHTIAALISRNEYMTRENEQLRKIMDVLQELIRDMTISMNNLKQYLRARSDITPLPELQITDQHAAHLDRIVQLVDEMNRLRSAPSQPPANEPLLPSPLSSALPTILSPPRPPPPPPVQRNNASTEPQYNTIRSSYRDPTLSGFRDFVESLRSTNRNPASTPNNTQYESERRDMSMGPASGADAVSNPRRTL